ncbi:MAG: hypothetical protein ACYS7Y_30505 [Planctomycetota bacterium]|jgi:hypothetical protein
MMKFKELKEGDRFVFASEYDPRFYGLAKGPWIKVSARCYRHFFETEDDSGPGTYGKVQVGSVNVAVMQWPQREGWS